MSSESITAVQEQSDARSTAIVVPWHQAALGAVLLLAAVVNFVQLDRIGLGNTYYAAAVKSMMQSWHNFFYVAFDPGGFVTIDKPPVAFWLQTASAKLFGFGGMSLLLPEAIAGVLSVAVLYALVARVFGRPAGLLAALALALTPVAVVVNRSNLVESILVLTMLLAAFAVTLATERGRLRWLLLGAVLLGIGFNVKTLEAYLMLPALILVYLLGSPVRWWTRLWHLILAALVLFAVSLSWIVAVDLTPASQRPYVASSGDNSELSLALGYNGLGRLTGNVFSFRNGGTTLSNTLSDLSPTSLGFTRGETGAPGIQRLVNAELGGQSGWLLMLAVIGFVAAACQRRIRFPLDRQQQALVLWGAWLVTGGAFFSVAGFFHAYYLATIAPPVAALAGIGVVTLWQDYRRPGWRGWALPFALVASALVEAYILSSFPDWSRWLTPLVVGSSILLAIVLLALRLGRRVVRPAAFAALALGVLALLLPPTIWSEYTVANASAGMTPSAGPQARGGFGGFGGARPRLGGRGGFPFGPPGASSQLERLGTNPPARDSFAGGRDTGFPDGPGGFDGRGGGFGGDDVAANPQLVRYLEAHQGRARFLVATLNAGQAEPFILSTGKPVMDLGGFMGGDRILTAQQLATLVSRGTIRYFLVSGRGPDRSAANLPRRFRAILEERGALRGGELRGALRGGFAGGFGGAGNANGDLTQWVSSHCSVVPSTAYGMASASSIGGFGFGGAQPLYDCGAYAAKHPAG